MDDLLGGGFALYAHINAFICIFGLLVLNLTCIDMNTVHITTSLQSLYVSLLFVTFTVSCNHVNQSLYTYSLLHMLYISPP